MCHRCKSDTSKLIYQVNDGAVASVAVYDKGVAISYSGDFGSYSAFESASPAASTFVTWLAGGLFRLGANPVGQITCDATQTASPANHTAAQIIKALCLGAGIPAAQISSGDVAALDAVQPGEMGIWVATEGTPLHCYQ